MAPVIWTIYRIFAVIELLTLALIIVYDHYHAYVAQTKLSSTQQQRNPGWTKTYRVLSQAYIILTFLYTLNLILSQNNAYQISTDYGCYVRIVVNSIIYNSTKAALYSLLVSRLCASYNGTHYYISSKIIVALFASIGIYYTYSIFNIITVLSGYFVGFDETQISSCLFYATDYFSVLVVLLFDLIISIILVILFLKPIHKLLKQNKDDEDFIRMIVKTSTLTSWVIFSSLLSIAIYAVVLNSIVVLILDNIINVIGVLLMKQIHHNLYKNLCSPFNKCCLCLCCCGYRKNLYNNLGSDSKKQKTVKIEIHGNSEEHHDSQEKRTLKEEESTTSNQLSSNPPSST